MKFKFLLVPVVVIALFLVFYNKPQKEQSSLYHEIPSEFHDDREKFVSSITALNEARDLSNSMNIVGKIPQADEDKILDLSNQGVSLSYEISDDFLNMLHPELKLIYREKLVQGTEVWLRGIENEDINQQVSGSSKTKGWVEWFEKNKYDVGRYLFE